MEMFSLFTDILYTGQLTHSLIIKSVAAVDGWCNLSGCLSLLASTFEKLMKRQNKQKSTPIIISFKNQAVCGRDIT